MSNCNILFQNGQKSKMMNNFHHILCIINDMVKSNIKARIENIFKTQYF